VVKNGKLLWYFRFQTAEKDSGQWTTKKDHHKFFTLNRNSEISSEKLFYLLKLSAKSPPMPIGF